MRSVPMRQCLANLPRVSAGLAMLALPAILANAQVPLLDRGFTAVYQVRHNNTSLGINTQTLEKITENTWEYRGTAEPRGLAAMFLSDHITERSTFMRRDNTIRPTSYFYLHRKSRNREKRTELEFNWNKMILTHLQDQNQFVLSDHTQDLMSFQLFLMQHLQQQQTPLTVAIATRKGITHYDMHIKGEEKLSLPSATYQALRLESEAADKDRYILWFAKELEYLPVKVRKIEEDGDRIEFELQSLTKK